MIELTDIYKSFGSRLVISIPHLCFHRNKRYALMGVNGSGKTTLLRILAGILLPDKGFVRNPDQEFMGYMPQSPYAFSFSVRKNVEIALQDHAEADSRAAQALEAVGIAHLIQSRGHTLSGGETQRMAFARMIALPRRLLLLDEPTSAADIQGTDQIEKVLLEYLSRIECTLIFSTHSPAQALRLADEVVFLDQGEIIERGDACEVLHSPKDPRTQLFLNHWKL